MGLAPDGSPKSEETAKSVDLIKTNLVNSKEVGTMWLDQSYFNYSTGLRMVNDKIGRSFLDLE